MQKSKIKLSHIILSVLILFSLAGCDTATNQPGENPTDQVDISPAISLPPNVEETSEINEVGTDWNSYEPLYIGSVPVGCLMVPDAEPENISDCIKQVLQCEQSFYAERAESKYIKEKMVVEGLLDIYGCAGTAIFNFDWSETLSSIVFKFENGGNFTPNIFNELHEEISNTLEVENCWGEEYGLHKEAQNGHYYSCSWKGDNLKFECELSCYFNDNGEPDGGMIQFERTVTWENWNASFESLGKSDTVTQSGLTAKGTYHAGTNPYVEGILTNDSTETVKFVKIKVSLYDDQGKVIDTTWTYAVGAEGIAPGESSQWEVYCSNAEAIKLSFID